MLRECCLRDGSLSNAWAGQSSRRPPLSGSSLGCPRLAVYDKMGQIVLHDIQDKFKRPQEEVRRRAERLGSFHRNGLRPGAAKRRGPRRQHPSFPSGISHFRTEATRRRWRRQLHRPSCTTRKALLLSKPPPASFSLSLERPHGAL